MRNGGVDCMVVSWILNSMAKEIAEAFLYAGSARELWKEIEEHYGESNGPMIYHIQREISSIHQGNLSIMQYYSKLKKFWDELNALDPIPQCTCEQCNCGAVKRMTDREASNKLMQFLMALNESYDLKNQILSMDPWPTVNRAYSMIMQVEKQRQVQMVYSESSETNALFTRMAQTNSRKGGTSVRGGAGRSNFRRSENWRKKKENQFCNHCNRSGHDRESCFKLNGYPDWFKALKDQRHEQGVNRITAANSTETPSDVDTEQDESRNREAPNNLSNLIQQELMKLIKGKLNMRNNHINFANLEDFTGPKDLESDSYWSNDRHPLHS